MSSNSKQFPALNLLSLDGGGITGLSSLLIIKEIMNRMKQEDPLGSTPKPYEVFDMIAGTGTGAISAVMLGRLHMSIDDAIESYNHLMRTVFSKRKRTFSSETGAFKATVLERELKSMVRLALGDEDAKMIEEEQGDEGRRCKVLVYAMSSYNLTSALPIAFRSYRSAGPYIGCAIWEALRATTAHPQMFKGIQVDIEGAGLRNMFTHGGFGCYNPTPRLLEEARQEYPGRSVASIVSIGAGHPQTIQIKSAHTGALWIARESIETKVMRAAQEMTEGSERVAEEMARRFANAGAGYYRLNVEQGIQGVEANDWERLDEVSAHTQAYLVQNKVKLKLDRLVEITSRRTAVWETSHIDGRAVSALEPMRDGIRSCPSSSPRFAGRQKYTAKARAYFTSASQGRRVFVLYGLGGAGKTQIALRCAEELRERLVHTLFVDASSEENLRTSFSTIALSNSLGESYSDALKWISRHARDCLLVLDNADDPKVTLETYFPQSSNYNVIITTRCPEFADLTGDVDAVCSVSGMEVNEAVELLLKTTKLTLEQISEADKAALYEMLKASPDHSFDYLALAVVQAGAYIWKMRLSISQYWDRFSTRRRKLPEGNTVRGLDGYIKTVYTTWDMSLNQLSPQARELLCLMSFLHRDGIMEDMFRRAARNVINLEPDNSMSPEQQSAGQWINNYLSRLLNDGKPNDRLWAYIEELLSFSLVTYDHMTQTYSTHPLVQGWAQTAALAHSISPQHTGFLVALSIDWGRSSEDYAYKQRILPHVNETAAELGDALATADRLAEAYRATGQYDKEADLLERAIKYQKRRFGMNDPRTLAAMSSLGRSYWEMGKIAKGTELLRTSLELQLQFTGQSHPETLKTTHHLAWVLSQQNQFAESEVLLSACIGYQKQVLGEEHRDTLESMDDLASIYEGLGELTKAEALRVTVLATRKRVLGEDHADTLEGMHNLALTYDSQGRLEDAEALCMTVIVAQKRVLGDDHPNTLTSMHSLALTYEKRDRLEEAEALYTTHSEKQTS